MKKVGKLAAALVVMAAAIGMMGCAQPSNGNDNPGTPQVVGPDYGTCVVGDFILKNGEILKNSDSLTLSDTQKSNVAAVIVRAADKSTNTPALGVGIKHSKSQWCDSDAEGSHINISALQGTKTSGYMDGSDSWNKVMSVCSDAKTHPDYYYAFNYCLTYGTENSLTGDLAAGWYLPTLAELYSIYNNMEVVKASLLKAGGSTFETNWYWSCNHNTSDKTCALLLNLYSGNSDVYSKVYSHYYVCCVIALK